MFERLRSINSFYYKQKKINFNGSMKRQENEIFHKTSPVPTSLSINQNITQCESGRSYIGGRIIRLVEFSANMNCSSGYSSQVYKPDDQEMFSQTDNGSSSRTTGNIEIQNDVFSN